MRLAWLACRLRLILRTNSRNAARKARISEVVQQERGFIARDGFDVADGARQLGRIAGEIERSHCASLSRRHGRLWGNTLGVMTARTAWGHGLASVANGTVLDTFFAEVSLGSADGSANPDSNDAALMESIVWVGAGEGEASIPQDVLKCEKEHFGTDEHGEEEEHGRRPSRVTELDREQ